MEHNKLKVGIFVPCCADQFLAPAAHNMVKILEQSGLQCHYPDGVTCCGHHLFWHGDTDGAKTVGAQVVEAFRGVDCVVALSSGCASFIRHDYPALFAHSSLYNEALNLAAKCYDVSDFLVNGLHYAPSAAFPHRVAYVAHGRSLRDYPALEAPRTLLSALSGITLIDAGELDLTLPYSSTFTPIAAEMLRRTLERAQEQHAQYIAVSEPSLLLQLQGYCAKQKIDIRCRHIIDFLV
ncbi:MAG: (Fe-S)-binding protein [Bacteroidales bacterium]|nr:(Fe-S)-binding protein [Bacteroidales bacterium]